MKNLTSSVYTFEKIVKDGYLYVDKTEHIWRLIEPPCGIYFLSRPRRFGKSLTISTLKAVFQGKRELFKGLALETKQFDWKPRPVIHLDLGDRPADTVAQVQASLTAALDESAATLGVSLKAQHVTARFRELVLNAAAGGENVVILIDEYDKPILDNLTRPEAGSVREVLQSFYSVIKATEPHQRFVLMTGVSKFSKVSVFSSLNNLTDISMDARFATMLGYTQQELETNFADRLAALGGAATLGKLKEWYNGYRFEEDAPTVYNPVSIAKFFESGGKFKSFWFETGTPSFLIKLLKDNDYDLPSLENLELDESGFSAYEVDHLAVEPLLYQTGYLTLHGYDPVTSLYTLGYPNREVENAFMRHLSDAFTPLRKELSASHVVKLAQAAGAGDVDAFMGQMKVFFENIPYNITLKNEKYYQTVFYLALRLVGVHVDAEVCTAAGRIDAVVRTPKHIFVMEFKLDGSAGAALRQIREKGYADKYRGSEAAVTLVGAAFDPETRNIGSWLTEPA